MSKGHMIIMGGFIEIHDTMFEEADNLTEYWWPSLKRSAGSHRIATVLREEGYDVEVLDFWPAWSRLQLIQFFQTRVREDTLAIGISMMFPFGNIARQGGGAKNKIQEMLQTVKFLKELYPHVKFVGGSQNLISLIDWDLDYYVTGYAELAISELLKYFKREFNTLKITQRKLNHKQINVIDSLHDYPAFPMPTAHIKYEERDYIKPTEVLSLELSRGCKFACKFCAFSLLGVKGDYSRCKDSLREELLDNYNKWGVTNYNCTDETINDKPEKLAKYAEVIRDLPFQPHMGGFMRADLLVAKPDTWQDIYDMGLRSHYYGLESFNHEAAKYVGKGMNPDKLKTGLLKIQEWFKDKEAGRGDYMTHISIILGLPGETKESFIEGTEWLLNNFGGYSYGISVLYMGDFSMANFLSHPSEFENTWREGDTFTQLSLEELKELDKADPIKIPSLRTEIFDRNQVKWAHDTMNIWEAYKTFDEMMLDSNSLKNHVRGPGPFSYHRFLTTGKYTINDIYDNHYGENGFEQITDSDINSHREFINDYINKKLGKE